MAMKLIKKTAEYKIFMRGDDRYAVQDASGKPVNGEEKVRILVEEDMIKVTLPSPKDEVAESEDTADSEDFDERLAMDMASLSTWPSSPPEPSSLSHAPPNACKAADCMMGSLSLSFLSS